MGSDSGPDKEARESDRKKLKEIVEETAGDVDGMVKAAFQAAEEDPRGTLELVDGPIKSEDDDGRSTLDLVKKIKKDDDE